MLEPYYNFLKKFCDTEKYEELEMDTDCLFSFFWLCRNKALEDITLPEKENEWEAKRSRDCTDSFTAHATGNFFPRTCCTVHRKHERREPGPF